MREKKRGNRATATTPVAVEIAHLRDAILLLQRWIVAIEGYIRDREEAA